MCISVSMSGNEWVGGWMEISSCLKTELEDECVCVWVCVSVSERGRGEYDGSNKKRYILM